jgi:hypothetical protein
MALFELPQKPPEQPVPVQFAVSAKHESVDPYIRSSPAGFQAMLPDRSSKIRPSGAVEVVKSASSPLCASTAADIRKQQIIPKTKTPNTFVFMAPPISKRWRSHR